MKVAFDHHSPYLLAHGGFQIQIERTLAELKKLGVEANHLRWWDDSTNLEIIHFFGKPNSYYLEFAKNKGIKTVVSELHGGTGSKPAWRLRIQSAIIGLLSRSAPRLSRRMGWDSHQLGDRYVALTPFEAHLMVNVFHTPASRIHVIPNGVEDVFLKSNTMHNREDWLIFTGTITERKRALELAKAAGIAKVTVKMFGRPYSESDPYYLSFLRAVNNSGGHVQFLGEVTDRSVLAANYRTAKGLVLPSSMESLSLTVLEAAACDCPLLVTDLPWARSTLGTHANYMPNTDDPAIIAQGLQAFHANPKSPKGYKVLSWAEVAGQLKSLYENIGGT